MPKKILDHDKCYSSTGIHDHLTFGQGRLDEYGFWEFPCYHCAREHEKEYPTDGPCWPHTKEYLDNHPINKMLIREEKNGDY